MRGKYPANSLTTSRLESLYMVFYSFLNVNYADKQTVL